MTAKAEIWKKHLAAIKREGGSTSAYAKRHNIALATLYYWRSRLKIEARSANSEAKQFVALHIVETPRPQASSGCALILPGGIRLEMEGLPAPEWLDALARAAQGAR